MLQSLSEELKQRALHLHNKFQETSTESWNLQDIVCELSIQSGHLLQAVNPNNILCENGRNLSSVCDEAADVFLQILVLSHIFPIQPSETQTIIAGSDAINIEQCANLTAQGASQLLESSMRLNGKRFPQARDISYGDEYSFFTATLTKMLGTLIALVEKLGGNLVTEFNFMEKSALTFVNQYSDYASRVTSLKLAIGELNHKITSEIKSLHKRD